MLPSEVPAPATASSREHMLEEKNRHTQQWPPVGPEGKYQTPRRANIDKKEVKKKHKLKISGKSIPQRDRGKNMTGRATKTRV